MNISRFYNDIVKRCIDVVLAIFFLLWVWPLYLILAILIKCDSPGPVLYRPLRGGYHNKPFRICKFRSMVVDADKIGGGTTALNDSRITRVGRWLRKTKLDETPQLFNILLGEMSFIGPRPELLRYTDQYTEEQKFILEVRPGISDISSLHFIALDEVVGAQNADEYYEKYVLKQKNKLRLEYVARQSLSLDIQIFFATIGGVIKKTGKLLKK